MDYVPPMPFWETFQAYSSSVPIRADYPDHLLSISRLLPSPATDKQPNSEFRVDAEMKFYHSLKGVDHVPDSLLESLIREDLKSQNDVSNEISKNNCISSFVVKSRNACQICVVFPIGLFENSIAAVWLEESDDKFHVSNNFWDGYSADIGESLSSLVQIVGECDDTIRGIACLPFHDSEHEQTAVFLVAWTNSTAKVYRGAFENSGTSSLAQETVEFKWTPWCDSSNIESLSSCFKRIEFCSISPHYTGKDGSIPEMELLLGTDEHGIILWKIGEIAGTSRFEWLLLPNQFDISWNHGLFSAHSQSVLVTAPQHVAKVSYRHDTVETVIIVSSVEDGNLSSLLVSDDEIITAVAHGDVHGYSRFCYAIATTKALYLLDERYCGRPLARWTFEDVNISDTPKPIDYIQIIWNPTTDKNEVFLIGILAVGLELQSCRLFVCQPCQCSGQTADNELSPYEALVNVFQPESQLRDDMWLSGTAVMVPYAHPFYLLSLFDGLDSLVHPVDIGHKRFVLDNAWRSQWSKLKGMVWVSGLDNIGSIVRLSQNGNLSIQPLTIVTDVNDDVKMSVNSAGITSQFGKFVPVGLLSNSGDIDESDELKLLWEKEGGEGKSVQAIEADINECQAVKSYDNISVLNYVKAMVSIPKGTGHNCSLHQPCTQPHTNHDIQSQGENSSQGLIDHVRLGLPKESYGHSGKPDPPGFEQFGVSHLRHKPEDGDYLEQSESLGMAFEPFAWESKSELNVAGATVKEFLDVLHTEWNSKKNE